MTDHAEILAVELIMKSKNIIIFEIYRPPNTDVIKFIDLLSNLVIKAQKFGNKLIYLAGDFNIDLLNEDHRSIKIDFLNSLYSNNLLPVLTKPTRITEHSSSLIDNIFTNNLNLLSSGIIYSDISDHLPIFIMSNKSEFDVQKKAYCTKLNYSPSNINSVNKCLSNTDWSPVLNSTNVDISFENFLNILHTVIEPNCPPIRLVDKIDKNPWFTPSLKKASKKITFIGNILKIQIVTIN